MKKWLKTICAALVSAFRERSELALENLALRQQLAIMKNSSPRPKLGRADQLFWLLLAWV